MGKIVFVALVTGNRSGFSHTSGCIGYDVAEVCCDSALQWLSPFSFADLPYLVWILGYLFVFWGTLRVAVRPNGRHLGFSRDEVVNQWLGKRGMVWNRVFPEFHHFAHLDRLPDVLVLHVGGNELGARPFTELIFDLLRLWAMFPGL